MTTTKVIGRLTPQELKYGRLGVVHFQAGAIVQWRGRGAIVIGLHITPDKPFRYNIRLGNGIVINACHKYELEPPAIELEPIADINQVKKSYASRTKKH